MNLAHDTVLHTPPAAEESRNGISLFLDPEGPNWIGTDARGARILALLDGKRNLGEVARAYAAATGTDAARSWLHVDAFVRDALRHGFAAPTPFQRAPYAGREAFLVLEGLEELWLHTNDWCNLECTHCLVSSSPAGDHGLPTADLLRVIAEAQDLGARRFYFTGGEPFLRKDVGELIAAALARNDAELAVLTNGTPLTPDLLRRLADFPRAKLRLQISLDGSTAAVNDPIRGAGTFERIVAGIRNALAAGFAPTVTSVVTAGNADDIPQVARLAAGLGIRNYHLLWMHRRGRALAGAATLETARLRAVVRAVRAVCAETGMTLDNLVAVRNRVNARRFTRHDLSNAAWASLCVGSDGSVYPSAAFAGVPALRCGSVREAPLATIWRESPVCRQLRSATVQHKPLCGQCPIKFLCGGGDAEHSYFYAAALDPRHGTVLAPDPYSDLHRELVLDTLFELVEEGRRSFNPRSGWNAPAVLRAMGEGAVACGTHAGDGLLRDFHVAVKHSECVLSFDLDASRRVVRAFYAKAAEEPQPALCCPVSYPADEVGHIPKDVIDRFYGCGSPMVPANVQPGETVVDLGSGAGIDCFIAAKKVGARGRVIGVDMTDPMLGVAGRCKTEVAKNLGFDVVEFRKGFLEEVPVETGTVDVVTSNCVINLSPDKGRVFAEMWRLLKDHGRILVSDIVSDREVPPHLRVNAQLWGECLSGALTGEAFLAGLERAGFYGLAVLKKLYWKNVEDYRFYSVTVRGYKFRKKDGCVYVGQRAIYQGPFKAIVDEEGHLFPRGEAVEVCTDTAAKLAKPPYQGLFVVSDPTRPAEESYSGCAPGCC